MSAVLRVLIVDDEAIVRRGLRLILEHAPGIEVVGEAENGRDGVALATQLAPDVVLMDVRMPELDGIEATKAVVAGGARVLVLTTQTSTRTSTAPSAPAPAASS